MIQDLIDLHNSLKYYKDYLRKLGPERRKSELALKKFEEAKVRFNRLESIRTEICQQIDRSEISSRDTSSINKFVDDINSLYSKIVSLMTDEVPLPAKMATDQSNSFDIKTAISLLPVMTGSELITKQLIDGIELYSTMIKIDTAQQLITFVLKTRLSESAKLRMNPSYSTVPDLIKDMRLKLLSKVSPVAIQTQMQQSKQGFRSIESYGRELENLFVKLTLAQANGDDRAYTILRPINEKAAIKRFSDGLSDPRLSTIIASRQFSSLPEAITTAIDENTTSTENQVMKVSNFHSNNRGNRGCRQNSYQGRQNHYNSFTRVPNYNSRNYNRNNNSNFRNLPNTYYNSNRSNNWQSGNNMTRKTFGNSNQSANAARGRIDARAPGIRPRNAPHVHLTQQYDDGNVNETNISDNNLFFRAE